MPGTGWATPRPAVTRTNTATTIRCLRRIIGASQHISDPVLFRTLFAFSSKPSSPGAPSRTAAAAVGRVRELDPAVGRRAEQGDAEEALDRREDAPVERLLGV